jgi:hypothetical protein
MSGKRGSLFAHTHSIFFQDTAHLFDRVVPDSLGTSFLDESPNCGRGKFTVSHQNNQKKVWNCDSIKVCRFSTAGA